jgi:hypothetical protein
MRGRARKGSALFVSEIVRAYSRQLYLVHPNGIGRSRLTNVFLKEKLGIRGTARNWNTDLKLASTARRILNRKAVMLGELWSMKNIKAF